LYELTPYSYHLVSLNIITGMGILTNTRTKETFRSKIEGQSEGSQSGTFLSINNFESFCMQEYGKANIIPDMLKSTDDEVYDTLQNWISYMNNTPTKRTGKSLDPATVKMYFSRVNVYLRYMGIKLHAEDVKAELSFKRVSQEERYSLQLDDINKILDNIYFPMKVQLLCQLSSLMRIGEIVQLRKKHLILDKQNMVVKIPSAIAKLKKARTTVFSKEASAALRPKLRGLSDNDLVFGSNEKAILAEQNSGQILRRLLEKIGLDMKNSKGNNEINTHSFRAYGYTKLADHDPVFARKIAGHNGYLENVYSRKNDDELLARYQEFEYELTIDQTKKDKVKIAQLEEDAKIKMEAMAKRLETLEGIMKEKDKRLNQKD
jgi:integrase